MMLRFLLVLGLGVAAAVLVDTSLSQNTAGVLETLYLIREESVAVREESVAVREESLDVREEARDAREEARDAREEAREVRQEAVSLISQAYDMRDSTSELESSLVEAISLVMEAFHERNQSELYMKQIRDGMMTLIEKVDRLERMVDGFGEKARRIEAKVDNASTTIEMTMETIANSIEEIEENVGRMEEEMGDVKEKVEEMSTQTTTTSERLATMSELLLGTSGKIEALSVSASSVLQNRGDLGADRAVDGNIHTQLHTEAGSDEWFKMSFPGTCRVDRIVLINGKTNVNIWRLDQSAVYVVVEGSREALCGKVQVREGTTFESQTYTLDCSLVGVGVIVHNHASNYLEIREFEVYGACTGQI